MRIFYISRYPALDSFASAPAGADLTHSTAQVVQALSDRLKLEIVLDWLQVDVIFWADLFDLLIEALDHAHIYLSKAALLIIDR